MQRAKKAKIAIFDDSTLIWSPSPAKPREYPHKLYFTKTAISGLHFCC